tara:strand:- start:1223 stop:1375 length:153 start_codon:yes stop_codon:yes gene_type:complete
VAEREAAEREAAEAMVPSSPLQLLDADAMGELFAHVPLTLAPYILVYIYW